MARASSGQRHERAYRSDDDAPAPRKAPGHRGNASTGCISVSPARPPSGSATHACRARWWLRRNTDGVRFAVRSRGSRRGAPRRVSEHPPRGDGHGGPSTAVGARSPAHSRRRATLSIRRALAFRRDVRASRDPSRERPPRRPQRRAHLTSSAPRRAEMSHPGLRGCCCCPYRYAIAGRRFRDRPPAGFSTTGAEAAFLNHRSEAAFLNHRSEAAFLNHRREQLDLRVTRVAARGRSRSERRRRAGRVRRVARSARALRGRR